MVKKLTLCINLPTNGNNDHALVKVNYFKLTDRKDGFLRCFPKMLVGYLVTFSRTNDLLAVWSQTKVQFVHCKLDSRNINAYKFCKKMHSIKNSKKCFVTRSVDKISSRISIRGIIGVAEEQACDKQIDYFRAV